MPCILRILEFDGNETYLSPVSGGKIRSLKVKSNRPAPKRRVIDSMRMKGQFVSLSIFSSPGCSTSVHLILSAEFPARSVTFTVTLKIPYVHGSKDPSFPKKCIHSPSGPIISHTGTLNPEGSEIFSRRRTPLSSMVIFDETVISKTGGVTSITVKGKIECPEFPHSSSK